MCKVMFSILVVSLLAMVNVGTADEFEWDGDSNDNSFCNPDNWYPDGVPGPGDTARAKCGWDIILIDCDVTVAELQLPAYDGSCDQNMVMVSDDVVCNNWRAVYEGDVTGHVDITGGTFTVLDGGSSTRLTDDGGDDTYGYYTFGGDARLNLGGRLRSGDNGGNIFITITDNAVVNVQGYLRIGDDGGGNFTCSGNAQLNVHDDDNGLYFVCRKRSVTVDISGNCQIWSAGPFKLGNPGQQGGRGLGNCDMTMSGGTIDCEEMPIGVDTDDPASSSSLTMTGGLIIVRDTLDVGSDGGDGTVDLNGGVIQACHVKAGDGGLINVAGGTLEVTCGGSVDCDGGMINVCGGTVVLPGNQCDSIPACMGGYYVDIGGGCAGFKGELVCDYDPIEDKTTVTSLPPNNWKEWSPSPSDGAIWQPVDVVLCWCAGDCLLRHAVYFSENFDDVNDGTPISPCFRGYWNPGEECFDPDVHGPWPAPLELWKTYYWRVDEYHKVVGCYTTPPMKTKGDVWSFTTGCELIDGDINLDCVVNLLDYAMLADDWTKCVFFPDDVVP